VKRSGAFVLYVGRFGDQGSRIRLGNVDKFGTPIMNETLTSRIASASKGPKLRFRCDPLEILPSSYRSDGVMIRYLVRHLAYT